MEGGASREVRGVDGASGKARDRAEVDAEVGREVQREGVAGRGVSIAAGGGRRAGGAEVSGGGGFEIVAGFAGRFFARMRVSRGYREPWVSLADVGREANRLLPFQDHSLPILSNLPTSPEDTSHRRALVPSHLHSSAQ